MNNPTLSQTLEHMCGSGLVPSSPIDQNKAVLIIKAAEAMGDKALGLSIVKAARQSHRDWLTVTQRDWQIRPHRRLASRILRRSSLYLQHGPMRAYQIAAKELQANLATRNLYVTR